MLLFSKGRASPGLFFCRGAFVSSSNGHPGQQELITDLCQKRTKLLAKVWPNRTYSRPLPKRTNILAKFWQASSLLCRLRSSRQGGGDVGNDDNDDNGEEMNIKMLRMSVPGEPGVVSHPPYSNGIA